MFQACLLAFAVCMDTFFAAMGCSMNGIQIPKRCALFISLVGTAFLSLSLSGAQLLGRILPEQFFRCCGFVILFLLGSSQILKECLTVLFRKHPPHWKWKALGLVIDICFDETLADTDNSKILSLREAFAYSAALSLDSLASGLGAGIPQNHILFCLAFTFCIGFLLTLSGAKLGNVCCQKKYFSWFGGALLLVLAFCRIFCPV